MKHPTDTMKETASLKKMLAEMFPAVLAEGKRILKEHGDVKISDVTVAQAYGGMRGVKCMVTETSAVDPYGRNPIPWLQHPRITGDSCPRHRAAKRAAARGCLPWLLLTGEIPSAERRER